MSLPFAAPGTTLIRPRPPRRLKRYTDDPTQVPPGYGFRKAQPADMDPSLGDLTSQSFCQMWEAPLRGHTYVVSADVGDGLGKDRSSVDVLRRPTIERPAEQVAHFISDTIEPKTLAYVVDALGHYYCDDSGFEAQAAIECNNHGLSTQDTLQLHLGYRNFYRWEYMDAADASKRRSTRIGWVTTPRTRPIVLSYFRDAVLTVDPITGFPDLIVNSPWTIQDMRDFQTDGALWEAEAARGAFDDCVMSLAIGYLVAYRLEAGEREPLADRRQRFFEMQRRQREMAARTGNGTIDFRNQPFAVDEVEEIQRDHEVDRVQELEQLMDVRGLLFEDEYGGY